MEAGKELNNLISFHVFGGEDLPCIPPYSENITAAAKVMRNFYDSGLDIDIHGVNKYGWQVSISESISGLLLGEGEAETLPLAICIAALSATEYIAQATE